MAKFSENYPGKEGVKTCPLCQNHFDLQKFSFQCQKMKENIEIKGNYSSLFSEKVDTDVAKTVEKISKFRDKYEQDHMII